jgi:hypothetical protein
MPTERILKVDHKFFDIVEYLHPIKEEELPIVYLIIEVPFVPVILHWAVCQSNLVKKLLPWL